MNKSISYRPSIDGLRAVAVSMVILYHFLQNAFPGGYVGVDIFFVISGYLISKIIYTDINNHQFTVANFYRRRIRRIFPSLILVCLATFLAGWFFLWPSEFKNLGLELAGSAGFVSNLIFWRMSTGYFGITAELQPLLHIWSLGIEEQFYFIFPIFAFGLFRLCKAPRVRMGILAVAAMASLALCVRLTPVAQTAAFYLPVTRFWELLAGCMVALGGLGQPENGRSGAGNEGGAGARPFWRRPEEWAGVAGLLGVFLPAFLLNQRHPFPGFWAMAPTAGAALLIWAGEGAWVNQKLLSAKVLVTVGLFSYPLYLWH